jgi:Low molecular weight phosphotyrosine protein phosphatase
MRNANQSAKSVKHILFVCVENSNRSQMAEACARIHGAGRVEAHSAGSRPSGRINPDPKEMPPDQFRNVRKLIEQKVESLLESLGLDYRPIDSATRRA